MGLLVSGHGLPTVEELALSRLAVELAEQLRANDWLEVGRVITHGQDLAERMRHPSYGRWLNIGLLLNLAGGALQAGRDPDEALAALEVEAVEILELCALERP